MTSIPSYSSKHPASVTYSRLNVHLSLDDLLVYFLEFYLHLFVTLISVRDQLSNSFHSCSHNECHNDAKFSPHDSTVFGLLVTKFGVKILVRFRVTNEIPNTVNDQLSNTSMCYQTHIHFQYTNYRTAPQLSSRAPTVQSLQQPC